MANTPSPDAPPPRPQPYDLAVYVARLQPVLGLHLAQLRHALTQAPECMLVVAGARQALSPRNPLTLEQRVAMLWQELREDERRRIHLMAARDSYDTASWSDAVLNTARAAAPLASRYAVLYEPDSREPALPWAQPISFEDASAADTPVLDPLFDAAEPAAQLTALAPVLAPQGPAALMAWVRSSAFATLAREWHALRAMRAEWAGAPYPPVFVTVDVLVQCVDQVLLIRRGREPGKDLYALPGGFIEVTETLAASALRELAEETGLKLNAPELRGALRGSAVFDAPFRSQRGRVITHAYHFDLGPMTPPAIRAGDDAAAAFWLPLNELALHENQFHDDHFLIIDHFLQVAGPHAVPLTPPS